ncbi:MAG: DNA-binding protein WhiA, partial [Coriobacteriia bacterium]|nr:DNA-binding protein WhiA [Coriobacteriia bacterium]
MSFTADVRFELSELEQVHECCNKAELSALLRFDGTVTRTGSDQYRLEVSTENVQVARRIIRLAKRLYQLETEINRQRSVLHKAYNYQITIPNQPILIDVLEELGLAGSVYLNGRIERTLIKRDCCAIAYLRGA